MAPMMDRKLVCYIILWLLANCVSNSYQATVTESCVTSAERAQCYTVSFIHSVFEGHDATIYVNSSESSFHLTIYSNTATTELLKAYNITIHSACAGLSSLSVQQLYLQTPQPCAAELTTCSSTEAVMLVEANTDSVKNNVMYAQVRLPLPSSNFDLTIIPQFDGEEAEIRKSIPATSDITTTDIGTVVSAGKSSDCDITETVVIEPDPDQRRIDATIAACCIFSVLLVAAGVVSKIYVAYEKKTAPPKRNPEKEMVVKVGPNVAETSGTYRHHSS